MGRTHLKSQLGQERHEEEPTARRNQQRRNEVPDGELNRQEVVQPRRLAEQARPPLRVVSMDGINRMNDTTPIPGITRNSTTTQNNKEIRRKDPCSRRAPHVIDKISFRKGEEGVEQLLLTVGNHESGPMLPRMDNLARPATLRDGLD